MSAILDRQLGELGERFRAVEPRRLPSGTTLVTVPLVPLPSGWSAATTSVRFLVPASYPFAALDCFWVLVNQQLQPGSYEVDWDASAYPSGVYYYKLESGSFTETKKMVLIK